jgi:hypothetical protein
LSLTSLLTDTVDILRFDQTGDTPFGEATGTWEAATTGAAARVELTSFAEDRAGRTVNVQKRRVFLFPTVDVVDTDRVRWDGVDYPIETVDKAWGRAGVHHLVVWLQEAD